MDTELIKLLDELIDIFNNSSCINRLEELKKEIYKDIELKDKIDKLNSLDQYNSNYLELKQEIYNDSKIKEFKKIESNLLLLTLAINKRLKSLTREKGCLHENN